MPLRGGPAQYLPTYSYWRHRYYGTGNIAGVGGVVIDDNS